MKRWGILVGFVLLAAPAWAQNYRTAQVDCLTGSATAIGDNTNRVSLMCENSDSANPAFIGKSDVTSSTGYAVRAGANVTIGTVVNGSAVARYAIYCRSTGGTVHLTCWESIR